MGERVANINATEHAAAKNSNYIMLQQQLVTQLLASQGPSLWHFTRVVRWRRHLFICI